MKLPSDEFNKQLYALNKQEMMDYSNIDDILNDIPDQFDLNNLVKPYFNDIKIRWTQHARNRVLERKDKRDTISYILGNSQDKIKNEFIEKSFANKQFRMGYSTENAEYQIFVAVDGFNQCSIITFLRSGNVGKTFRNTKSNNNKSKLRTIRKGN